MGRGTTGLGQAGMGIGMGIGMSRVAEWAGLRPQVRTTPFCFFCISFPESGALISNPRLAANPTILQGP